VLTTLLFAPLFTLLMPVAVAQEEAASQEDASTPTDSPSNDELARRVEVLAEELERQRIGEAATEADEGVGGMGPAASKVYRGGRGVSLGGYGEVKYHHYADAAQDGSDAGLSDSLDVHRMILYIGYKFDDRWLLNAEIEFEHVTEVFVEFAYLDFRAAPAFGARAGLLLVPMGIINELHEPTTFPSVDRPQVDKAILPTTWREIGLGVYGDAGPFSYRAYLLGGMKAAGFSSGGLRGGRQKGAKATADDFAGVVRLDFVGVQGLIVGGSAYYGRSGQDLVDPVSGAEPAVSTLVYEGHASLDVAGIRVRALLAGASLGDVEQLNDALALTGADSVGEGMLGWYAELGYDVFAPLAVPGQALTPFVRYESLDTQSSVPAGWEQDPARDRTVVTAGLAWNPHRQIAVKADYQVFMNEAETGVNQLNAGIGFIF